MEGVAPEPLVRLAPEAMHAHSSRSSSLIAKNGPRSVANTDSSSSGHSTAASAARIASISSRS